ncbi:MAG: hypothetical protein IPK60_14930 [Sandaracinaceae bacterium]|nr:hypothetical protein [Sandaracinaceae bacterium]
MKYPQITYGTPRKLPRAKDLPGRVVVLDIAFAADSSGSSFDKTTKPLIDGLGQRLRMWVDHHDHPLHAAYASDPRFVLSTKAQHGACPEMVTEELCESVGEIDTICCHIDFDGLCSAAKWIRKGVEPYEGADDDARAIDTRIGVASERGATLDRAIRARPRDDVLRGLIVRFLAGGAVDIGIYRDIRTAADALKELEEESKRLARGYNLQVDFALVDTTNASKPYDKTYLLLLGQERAPISVVYDATTITAAAQFDSGIDLLALLGVDGGMPTRVSVPRSRLEDVLERLMKYKAP